MGISEIFSDSFHDYDLFENSHLKSLLYHGHILTLQSTPRCSNASKSNISGLLFPNLSRGRPDFSHWLEKDSEERDLARREISLLFTDEKNDDSDEDRISFDHASSTNCSKASLKKVWKKHKKKVLIALAVVVVVVAAGLIAAYLGATAATAGVTGLGGIAAGQLGNDTPGQSKASQNSKVALASQPTTTSSALSDPFSSTTDPFATVKAPTPSIALPSSSLIGTSAPTPVVFSVPYQSAYSFPSNGDPILSPSNNSNTTQPNSINSASEAKKKAEQDFNDWLVSVTPTPEEPKQCSISAYTPATQTPRLVFPELPPMPWAYRIPWVDKLMQVLSPSAPFFTLGDPQEPISRVLEIPGRTMPRGQLGGINGINTSSEDALSYGERLSMGSGNYSVEWTYNSTNSAPFDGCEAVFLNYDGISAPAYLLAKNWYNFWLDHQGDPDAKYLQFCHSQGAIHVKVALELLPKEIRDTVIVVAIAPAAIIPKSLCAASYNYASARDFVPYGEAITDAIKDVLSIVGLFYPSESMENLKELIILKPAEGAPLLDHSFNSPTFVPVIADHLETYSNRYGI